MWMNAHNFIVATTIYVKFTLEQYKKHKSQYTVFGIYRFL